MSVLVTGGCGYIGGHVVRALEQAGESVVVVDDLSTGIAARIAPLQAIVFDLARDGARAELREVMTTHRVDSVIHLAALKQVPDSLAHPTAYFRVNIASLTTVLDAANDAGVQNIVFSSSAAVYGNVHEIVTESTPTTPINPYGETKLVGEWLTADAARAYALRAVSLRYFNVAGAAAPELGDHAVTNLVPMVFERVRAGAPPRIFGDDYATADGSCVRDFIHVSDLAEAHVAAVRALRTRPDGSHTVYNVGTGVGVSVRAMVDLILEVSGANLSVDITDRRPGDPASVVADPSRIAAELGWAATRGVREMVESAWESDEFRRNRGRESSSLSDRSR